MPLAAERRDVRPPRRRAIGALLGVLALVVPAGPAFAVDGELSRQVKLVGERLDEIEGESRTIQENITQRSGLMGVVDARERFNDAAADYMLAVEEPNEVKRAAMFEGAAVSFSVLIESRALGNSPLARDAEFYFAECLYQLGNYVFALEVYDGIVRASPEHPNFADAVRRSLEIFPLVDDQAGFRRYYDAYVETKRIDATDEVLYTLGKSHYRQGDLTRAKEAFGQVPATVTRPDGGVKPSVWWSRARYFMGVIMLRQNNLVSAAQEFAAVADSPRVDGEDKVVTDVRDMALLALARVEYERGNAAVAQQRYEQIGPQSRYFPERMYELIWVQVTQERWNEAIQSIDAFALTYGASRENRYTANLQLLKGDIMLQQFSDFKRSPRSFQEAIDRYGPDLEKLRAAPRTPEELRTVLDGVAGGVTVDIPPYMLDSLRNDATVERAAALREEVRRQDGQIGTNETIAADVAAAIGTGMVVLKGFEETRERLQSTRGGLLGARDRLLDLEVRHLRSRMPSSLRGELEAFVSERAQLAGQLADADAAQLSGSDEQAAYAAQVADVQGQGLLLAEQLADAQRQLAELERAAATAASAEEVARFVSGGLAAQRRDLEAVAKDLDVATSDITRARLVGLAPVVVKPAERSGRQALMARYGALRASTQRWRRYATDTDSQRYFAELDSMWARIEAAEALNAASEAGAVAAEARDLAIVRSELERQLTALVAVRSEHAAGATESDRMALEAIRIGLDELDARYAEVVMKAERGLTDVYWMQSFAAGQERDALTLEQTATKQKQVAIRKMFWSLAGVNTTPDGQPIPEEGQP
jgi:TolA-binding protein